MLDKVTHLFFPSSGLQQLEGSGRVLLGEKHKGTLLNSSVLLLPLESHSPLTTPYSNIKRSSHGLPRHTVGYKPSMYVPLITTFKVVSPDCS